MLVFHDILCQNSVVGYIHPSSCYKLVHPYKVRLDLGNCSETYWQRTLVDEQEEKDLQLQIYISIEQIYRDIGGEFVVSLKFLKRDKKKSFRTPKSVSKSP